MPYVVMTTRATGYVVTKPDDWDLIIGNFAALRPDICIVGRTAVQSLTNTTPNDILWDYERYDSDGMHVAGENKITVKRYGIYLVTVDVSIAAHASGYDTVNLVANGTTSLAQETRVGNASINNQFVLTAVVDCPSGAYMYFNVGITQTSGGAINLLYVGSYHPSFTVTMLKDLTT
jgi:hypothetical protein